MRHYLLQIKDQSSELYRRITYFEGRQNIEWTYVFFFQIYKNSKLFVFVMKLFNKLNGGCGMWFAWCSFIDHKSKMSTTKVCVCTLTAQYNHSTYTLHFEFYWKWSFVWMKKGRHSCIHSNVEFMWMIQWQYASNNTCRSGCSIVLSSSCSNWMQSS